MNPTEKQVLAYILENPGQKTTNIAKHMSIPHGTVNSAVRQLRKYGHLKAAVFDVESPTYAQCWPVDKDFPAPTLTGGSADTGEAGGPGGESCTPPGLAPLTFKMEPQCLDTAAAVLPESELLTSNTSVDGSETFVGPGDTTHNAHACVALPNEPTPDAPTPDMAWDGPTVAPVPATPASPSDSPTATLSEPEQLRKDLEAAKAAQKTALEAVRLLAEENGSLRRELKNADLDAAHIRRFLTERNREAMEMESHLAEISWLCCSVEYDNTDTTSDTVKKLCFFLDSIGAGWAADALRERRRLLGEIAEREGLLRKLRPAIRARMEQKPETGDKCKCGREATKVEGEQGFTQCDPCYRKGEK